MAGPQILVVEDEYLTSTDIKNTLTNMGYGVPGVADTGAEAVRMAGELRPDLILMDITLKGRMTGIEAAVQIQQQYRIPVVFLTAHSDDATVDRAVSAEPFGFLIKPMNDLDLKRTIQMALYKHTMEERLYRSEQTIRALLNALPDARSGLTPGRAADSPGTTSTSSGRQQTFWRRGSSGERPKMRSS